MFLLIKPTLIINLDQVVDAEYIPASSGIDEETQKPFERHSKLTITTTSISAKRLDGYDGDTLGCASQSNKIKLSDKEADSVWKFFTSPETERTF